MHVVLSGSQGLVGTALSRELRARGHRVTALVRTRPGEGSARVFWDPAAGKLDAGGLEGCDALVHLAGENIAGRWSAAKRRRIRDSRVLGTRLLAEGLAGLKQPPGVMVSASAVGYYGDRGDQILTEQSGPGRGFLAEVVRDWEAATGPAEDAGVRVVHLRLGVVLTQTGGALARMLPAFRLGLGGRLGHGRQWMSWAGLDDVVSGFLHAIDCRELLGAVNLVSPEPVTNRDFTAVLGRVLRRPTPFPVPAFALRLLFGAMADEVLLAGARVEPGRLLETGFSYRYPELEAALRQILDRPA
jgi:uncharacterized protein (TIGR01777 family)